VDFVAGKTAVNVTAADIVSERENRGLNGFKAAYGDFNTILITKSNIKDFLSK